MTSTYVVGTSEFKTRADAVRRAQEYADDSGSPVTVAVERRKTDRHTRTRGRVLGFSASSLLPTKYFEVKPRKGKRNPGRKVVRLKNFTGTIKRNKNGTVSVVGRAKR